ncbi:PHD finger protein 7-like [Anopheles maculipalpis]|uniref:PHD finger protein 7-like n=1 Tax=Anopheles maculipalpis TaxID=1496333 RepID=UPI00215998B8|nr:PHD finger protein 7-like [Anopheles maculipalpis]
MNETTQFNVSYCTDPTFKLDVLKNACNEKCDICWLVANNPLRYGEFIEKTYNKNQKIRVHYFCLLSGTNIAQNGSAHEGIAGFRINDIINSHAEYRNKQCAYCSRPSAAIECAQPECVRRFHYICGYNNGCLTQFRNQMLSYCHKHLPKLYHKPINTRGRECDICFNDLPLVTEADYNPVAIVRTHCDKVCSDGFFHRECVQRFAYTSGYNFKCPLCWNKCFRRHAADSGIFIPQRESAWEREPGAFKDLHKRKCTADRCVLVNSRNKADVSQLVGCKVCGGRLMHKVCSGVSNPSEYLCSACKDESFANLV